MLFREEVYFKLGFEFYSYKKKEKMIKRRDTLNLTIFFLMKISYA